MAATQATYDPNDTSAFDLQRKKAAQQSASDLQTQKDALARRFAQIGNLDSGARLKQENIADDTAQKNLASANEGINAQQNTEMQRRGEVLQGQQFQANQAALGRQFQTSERLGSQDYGSQQALLGRQFQTGERLGSQDFSANQSQLGRDQQASQFGQTFGLQQAAQKEGVKQFDLNFNFQKDQAKNQQAAQAEAIKQFDLNYGMEREAQTFNEGMAEWQKNQPQGLAGLLQGLPGGNITNSLNNTLNSYLAKLGIR